VPVVYSGGTGLVAAKRRRTESATQVPLLHIGKINRVFGSSRDYSVSEKELYVNFTGCSSVLDESRLCGLYARCIVSVKNLAVKS